jgi:hypothetical protein
MQTTMYPNKLMEEITRTTQRGVLQQMRKNSSKCGADEFFALVGTPEDRFLAEAERFGYNLQLDG